jgi:hypothetical protein
MSTRPIRVGDVVRWHEIACEWTVTAADRAGLTIEAAVIDEDGVVRTVRRLARRSECRLVGEQLVMELE